MQLIHSITLTSLVVLGADESKQGIMKAFSKGIWGYLSVL